MEIEFSGKYEKSMYINAFRSVFNPSTRKTFIWNTVLVVLVVLYLWYIISEREKGFGAFDLFRIFRHTYKFLFVAGFMLWPYLVIYRNAIKMWNIVGGIEVHGFVTNLGIKTTGNGDFIKWDSITMVKQTIDRIAIVTNNSRYLLLSRDFFKTEDDWKVVQSMFANNVKPVIE